MSAATSGLPSASNYQVHRLVILGKGGEAVLIDARSRSGALPRVHIPDHIRRTESLQSAARERFLLSCVCLFMSPSLNLRVESDHRTYQVMEAIDAREIPLAGCEWVNVHELTADSLTNRQDRDAVREITSLVLTNGNDFVEEPFIRLGWIEELRGWVRSQVEPYGGRLRGHFRQLSATPTSALLRFQADGFAVWFKAVDRYRSNEASVSAALAQLFPDTVPTLIASHRPWNGWLTKEAEGPTLEESPNAPDWQLAATCLAKMQLQSIGSASTLIQAGCEDLRYSCLKAKIRPFIFVLRDLVRDQSTEPPNRLTQDQLSLLERRLEDACDEMAALNLPDALAHLDPNPGNIVLQKNGCVFLDWAEACFGPPFIALEYLRAHFRKRYSEDSSAEIALCASYSATWAPLVSQSSIAEAQRLAPLLAVFAYAVVALPWNALQESLIGDSASVLRRLARRMKREADLLARAKQ